MKNKLVQYIVDPDRIIYEKPNTEESKTFPNQAISVKKMMQNVSNGLPINANLRPPIYLGDEHFPKLQSLDIEEIRQLKEDTEFTIRDSKEKLKQLNAEAKKRQTKELEDKIKKLEDEKGATQ